MLECKNYKSSPLNKNEIEIIWSSSITNEQILAMSNAAKTLKLKLSERLDITMVRIQEEEGSSINAA